MSSRNGGAGLSPPEVGLSKGSARPDYPRDGGGQPGPEVPSIPPVSPLGGRNPNLSLAHPKDLQGPGLHFHLEVSMPPEQAAL